MATRKGWSSPEKIRRELCESLSTGAFGAYVPAANIVTAFALPELWARLSVELTGAIEQAAEAELLVHGTVLARKADSEGVLGMSNLHRGIAAFFAIFLVSCGGRASSTPQHIAGGGTTGSSAGTGDVAGEPETPSSNSGADGGNDGFAGATATCQTDAECVQHCASCEKVGCPGSCVSGQCFYRSCGAIDACAGKSCGDACSACYKEDGACTPGRCDRWGDCKAAVNSCLLDAPRPCDRADAVGAGFVNGKTCNVVQGWAWSGSECVAVVGCVCEGSDCGSLLQTSSDCTDVYISTCANSH